MSDDPATRARENATGIASMVVTGLWLALLLGGTNLWLPVLLFGYIVVVPLVALLYGDEKDRKEWWDDDWEWDEWYGPKRREDEDELEASADAPTTEAASTPGDALETLRERYAAGEITDDQFERKLERLLETESLEDADRWKRQPAAEYERRRNGTDERELEYDR